MTKFAVDIGVAKYKLRAKFNKSLLGSSNENIKLQSSIILDTLWDRIQEKDTCESKSSVAVLDQYVIPSNGYMWSEWAEGTLTSVTKRYFFVKYLI